MTMQYKKAIYQSKEYEIYYIYESGYCELRDVSKRDIILVPMSDLQLMKKDNVIHIPLRLSKVKRTKTGQINRKQ
jgi:hypothetical protein